jgi:hypothetical protein
MIGELNRDSSVEALITLPLKRASIQIGSRRKVAIGTGVA